VDYLQNNTTERLKNHNYTASVCSYMKIQQKSWQAYET